MDVQIIGTLSWGLEDKIKIMLSFFCVFNTDIQRLTTNTYLSKSQNKAIPLFYHRKMMLTFGDE